MPTQYRRTRSGHEFAVARGWRDRKRYVWLLGLVIPPILVPPMSWLAVATTGWGGVFFWWSGPMLMFIVIPSLDYLVGPPDTENPPDSALARLEMIGTTDGPSTSISPPPST